MKSLIFKELREIAAIALAALAGYLALVVNLMGARIFDWVPGMPNGTHEVPFTGYAFMLFFLVVSVVFAVVLGFRQSAWESASGTYLYLLHLPRSREAIFLTKLATGMVVLFVCAASPIVAYGWWASVPGHHAGPFEWSMTVPAWQMAMLVPVLYLGAFLSGLRPAWWFGTRLFPLIASGACLIALALTPWWFVWVPLAVLLYAVLISNVCHVARVRDYA